MAEIVIESTTYRIGKLTPKQQLHIARRIAPLSLAFKGEEDQVIAAFTEHVAKMSDADVDAIVDPCLAIVSKKIADGVWSPLTAQHTNQLMFDDLKAQDIFQIVVAVLKENLGGFFPGQGAAGVLASQVRPR
jgi:hypothetical protein